MTGDSFAQGWPGRGGWGRKEFKRGWSESEGPRRHGRHGGPANWFYAKGRHGGPFGPEDIEDLIAWRRMRGGPCGGPGGPWGRGPGGRGRGRARRGDVRLALLRLLAEEPRNGYQLMQTIEARSEGRWSPSPGSVYPTLSQLEDEGLIKSTDGEGSRLYTITDAGREHLETRAQEPDPWQPSDAERESALTELGPLVIQIAKAAWQVSTVGDPAQRARATEVLAETRRALYRILAEEPEGSDGSDESEV